MKRQYTICTEHLIIIKDEDKGLCPKCDGDRNLIGVVAMEDLKEEYLCPEHGPVQHTTFWNKIDYDLVRKCAAGYNSSEYCLIPVEITIHWKDNKHYA